MEKEGVLASFSMIHKKYIYGNNNPRMYGQLTYLNANGDQIVKQIQTPKGDYGRVYDSVYETIINGHKQLVNEVEMLTIIDILENGFSNPSPSVYKLKDM